MMEEGRDVIEIVVSWIKGAKSIVALTGAEVSAESGLPDFSSLTFNPHIGEFRQNRGVRVAYWKKIKELYPLLSSAEPNPAHMAILELEMLGNLGCVLTQTTDGLHQRAGSSFVIELHGTVLWVVCTQCGKDYRIDSIISALEKGKEVPECEGCRGDLLKPPISFPGQPYPHWELREAWMRLRQCALFLVVGSSLDTPPASPLPTIAKENGAKVVIINQVESLADGYVDAVIYGSPSQVLPYLVSRIKEGIAIA